MSDPLDHTPSFLAMNEASLLDAPLDPAVTEKLLHICADVQRLAMDLLTLAFYVLQHQAPSEPSDQAKAHLRRSREEAQAAQQWQAQLTREQPPANPYWSAGIR